MGWPTPDVVISIDPGKGLGYAVFKRKEEVPGDPQGTKEGSQFLLVALGTINGSSVGKVTDFAREIVRRSIEACLKPNPRIFILVEAYFPNPAASVSSSLTFGKRCGFIAATVYAEAKSKVRMVDLLTIKPAKWVSYLHLGGSTKQERVSKFNKQIMGDIPVKDPKYISNHAVDAFYMGIAYAKAHSRNEEGSLLEEYSL